jgi:transcriptional antiterminator
MTFCALSSAKGMDIKMEYSIQEVAEMTGVSTRTLRYL